MIDHFIDIYSKLLIGVISFIAPTTSYLLSTYITDRSKIYKKLQETKKGIDKVLEADVKEAAAKGIDARKLIESGNEKLKKSEEEIDKKVALLTFLEPKRRISTLFFWLFLAMGTLLADVLVRDDFWGLYNHYFSVFLLVTSCTAFVIALYQLRKIAWNLIKAKETLEEEEEELRQEQAFPEVTAEPEKK